MSRNPQVCWIVSISSLRRKFTVLGESSAIQRQLASDGRLKRDNRSVFVQCPPLSAVTRERKCVDFLDGTYGDIEITVDDASVRGGLVDPDGDELVFRLQAVLKQEISRKTA